MVDKPKIFKEKASAWHTVRLHKEGMILFRSLERSNCMAWIEQHYGFDDALQQDDKHAELNALFN